MVCKQALVEEYDHFYTKNPRIWIDDSRNKFAFSALSGYLKQAPASVLDVGCGNGHTIKYFSERWQGTHFTGLDLSSVAIKIAKKMNPGQRFINNFIDDVALPTFDCVLVMGVAEHFESLQDGLQSVRKTVSEHGVCYMEIPNCIGYSSSEKTEGFRRLTFGSKQLEWHLYRDSWDRELVKAGFKIAKKLNGVNIFSEFCYLLEVA